MAVFVQDTFTGSNGTAITARAGETGATWTRHPNSGAADPVIDTNRAKAGASNTITWHYASGTPASAEYDVSADLYLPDASTDDLCGVLGAVVTDADTMYRARTTGGVWTLERRVAGSSSTLGSYSQTLEADTTYALKLELRSSSQKLYVDGVQRASGTDSTIEGAGRAGIIMRRNNRFRLDNFIAEDTSGGGDTTKTIASGSLRFIGQAVVARHDVVVPVSAGSLQLNGQAAKSQIVSPVQSGSVLFSGQAVGKEHRQSIASSSLYLVGQTVEKSVTEPGVELRTVQPARLHLVGQTVSRRADVARAVDAGSLLFIGQSVTATERAPEDVISKIEAGSFHFVGQTFRIISGGKSGVERKRLSEQTEASYVHTSFLRPDAAKIIRERLGETADQDRIQKQLREVLEKDRQEVDLLSRRVAELESQLAAAKTRTKAKLSRNIVVLEEQLVSVSQEMAQLTHLLRLMEEDEIILAAVA